MADVTFRGFREFKAALRALGAAAPAFARRALVVEAEQIMTQAKRLTPVMTGALRASGQVVADETRARVVLGFGNSAVGYAVPVHENLQARHPGGQAKFLEQPLMEALRGMDARLAAAIKADVERITRKT